MDKSRPWPDQYNHYFKSRAPKASPDLAKKAMAGSRVLESTLEPRTTPLDRASARHFLRRIAFGASGEAVNALIGRDPREVVLEVIEEAVNSPQPDPPSWKDAFLPPEGSSDEVFNTYFDNNVTWGFGYAADWIMELYRGGLREKMVLFWHNHFVTEHDVYFFAPMAYRYMTCLRRHALGKFDHFVHDIGVDPAMMVYLNGNLNVRESPNENYARELLELFTMGQYDATGNENYTQQDIVEISRALTGWYVDYYSYSTQFNVYAYDAEEKTIFGSTEVFNYNRTIDLLFEQRGYQIAYFICTKLYQEFVLDEGDPAIIEQMVQTFMDNQFEIRPVLQQLLTSERFFDPAVRGARIKSPMDLTVGLLHLSGVEEMEREYIDNIFWNSANTGQRLLQPPNVAGWTGYRNWITTGTLTSRWEVMEGFVWGGVTGLVMSFLPLVRTLVAEDDPLIAFRLPEALAQHLLAVPPDQLGYEPPTGGFAGDLVTYPIPAEIQEAPAYVSDLAKIFLAGRPWYEWNLQEPGIVFHVLDYVRFLMNLPEYQLN